MREISMIDPNNHDIEKSLSSFGDKVQAALVSAIKEIKPPSVNVSPASVNIEREAKEKGSYLITVNRDGNGRVQSMVVEPYESY